MTFDGASIAGLVAAIGGGLLVGAERERRHIQPDLPIGIRTLTLTALAGAVSALLGVAVLVAGALAVTAVALASYRQSRETDPGLTTELSLLATYLLAALAMSHARLAAALFVVLAIILASKEPLHRFSRQSLSRSELNDFLLLAASALIVLPLLPDRAVDPLGALNPRKLWLLVVWVMAINTMGHVGLRVFGTRRGLAFAGFFGGFVSSTATIAGMAQRARSDSRLTNASIAASLLSNIATVIQLALILAVVAPGFLAKTAAIPLAVAAVTAVAVGAIALIRARGGQADGAELKPGRPFVFSQALLFALLVAAALLLSAALSRWKGVGGTYIAAAATGLADVHAAAIAIGQLAANDTITSSAALCALVIAFTANSALKLISASTGGARYFRDLALGIVALNGAFALTLFFG